MHTMTAENMREPQQKIRCVRAKFMIGGQPAVVDAVYTLPLGDAQRLIAAGHAVAAA